MAAEKENGKKGSRYARIWGLAKGLSLDKEDLYSLIYRETGKEHMSELTDGEINHVCHVLGATKGLRSRKVPQKRTDSGGNPLTVKMRRKIYMLTGTLGWNNDNSRINAFCKKNCGVERLEWLTVKQCSDVIEGLKKIIARDEEKLAREAETGN